MKGKFLNLKDEMKFRNHLIRNKMIKEYVGFDNGYNVVAIDFNGKTCLADMRVMGDNKNIRFSIYSREEDYIEEQPPFKCIGLYNKVLDMINIEQMDFAIGCNHSATIGYVTDPNRYEISSKTSTADYISTADKQRLVSEYIEAHGKGDDAVYEFYAKYQKEYSLMPLNLYQRFTFDKSPTAKLKNFNDGYKLAHDLFENNAEFGEEKLDEDSVFASMLATKNGITAMKKIGAHSVRSESWVDLMSFLLDSIKINMYSSTHRFAVDQKDGKEYTIGYLDSLDIKYIDDNKQLHYDLRSSMPHMFKVNELEQIIGMAKTTGQEKLINYLAMHQLNLRLNELSNKIYYGKDTKIKGIDADDMKM